MSVFGNGETDYSVNALLDPFTTISSIGIFTEQYFKIIKTIFGKFMYPGMVSVSVNYNGKEETIIMPGKIQFRNRIAAKLWQQHPFPVNITNIEKQHQFHFGNDIMQFVGSKDVYALSYYREGIVFFSIVLIANDCIYVVNINSKDDEIKYFELDSETKNKMQNYINEPGAYLNYYAYEELLNIFENAYIIRKHKNN